MQNWYLVLGLNVQVLANTHSTEEAKEVNKASQHSTRCADKNLGKQTTYRSPEVK